MKHLAAFSLILLTSGTFGCSWFSDQPASNSALSANANQAAANTAPAVVRENPVADIDAMADKFLAQKSFRVKRSVFGDKDFTTVVEYVSPDRFHIKTGPGLEQIRIGNDLYITLDNSWEKIPTDSASPADGLRRAFKDDRSKFFSNVRFVRVDSVDGKDAYLYEYENSSAGMAGSNDSKIWIGKDDRLPIRIESIYKTGSVKSEVIEYQYDPNIKIEVPKTK